MNTKKTRELLTPCMKIIEVKSGLSHKPGGCRDKLRIYVCREAEVPNKPEGISPMPESIYVGNVARESSERQCTARIPLLIDVITRRDGNC